MLLPNLLPYGGVACVGAIWTSTSGGQGLCDLAVTLGVGGGGCGGVVPRDLFDFCLLNISLMFTFGAGIAWLFSQLQVGPIWRRTTGSAVPVRTEKASVRTGSESWATMLMTARSCARGGNLVAASRGMGVDKPEGLEKLFLSLA